MAGSGGKYICNRRDRMDERHCKRAVTAAFIEEFVIEAALRRLESLNADLAAAGPVGADGEAVAVLSDSDRDALALYEQELAELKAGWEAQEFRTSEYREMRKTVEKRISAIRSRTVIRPAAEVLSGLIGPNARKAWQRLADSEDYARMNAVLRFLFAAVVIDESRGQLGRFDYDRITIEANPL